MLRPFFVSRNIFDSLEVLVLFTTDRREVMAKRKGEITLEARRNRQKGASR